MEKDNAPISLADLQRQMTSCRAAIDAQNMMVKALIATHPRPDVVMEAFAEFSERSVSVALASPLADGSIEAFEMFRNRWTEWIRQHADAVRNRQPRA